MERKIGEIFEFDGEWYQCMKGNTCNDCAFYRSSCGSLNDKGSCRYNFREDATNVIFKKLEKWGKPYPNADKLYQLYILPMNIEKLPPHTVGINLVRFDIVEIEIKQNKEDMEEYEMHDAREDIPEFDKVVDECLFGEDKPNLKPFNLEAAKAGKPVCTRDGRKARVICFDSILKNYPLVVLIEEDKEEYPYIYTAEGEFDKDAKDSNYDLMMLPEKKEGWYNVYKSCIYSTKKEAKKVGEINCNFIKTIKVEWEE